MSKKPKPNEPKPNDPEAGPSSEETLILNPGAAMGTVRMPVMIESPMEATQIIAPDAGDETLSGVELPAIEELPDAPTTLMPQVPPLAPDLPPVPQVRVPLPAVPLPPMEDSGATHRFDPKAVLAGQSAPLPPRPTLEVEPADAGSPGGRGLLWGGLGAAALLVAGGAWYFLREARPAEAAAPAPAATAPAPAPVPAGYQSVLARAKEGDVAAMRTLGVVYYYGLGVVPDPEEGLRWYRKAADAGSQVARDELKQLEGAVNRPKPTAKP